MLLVDFPCLYRNLAWEPTRLGHITFVLLQKKESVVNGRAVSRNFITVQTNLSVYR